jgi:RNA polymerase sigma factor (sigma-70 family)
LTENKHLSRIETQWSVVQRAHETDSAGTMAARASLIERYGGAVRRYLMASLRDADAVDDAFQEFSLRFVRGDFSAVSPEKGRFRNYLKTVVYHLIADYGRSKKKYQAAAIEHESLLAAPMTDDSQHLDAEFLSGWRETLLTRAWDGLLSEEEASGKPWFTVLRCRAEYPEARSPELAEIVTQRTSREISAGNVRVLLHRARDRFAELLLADVRESLDGTDDAGLQDELMDLDLWTYCKHVLRDGQIRDD